MGNRAGRGAGAYRQPRGRADRRGDPGATSVNEQTLTFVPKLAVIAVMLVLFGASMFALVEDFTVEIFAQIAGLGR